ncbi:MAG: hypothetical protein ACRCUE_20570 [Bosea sp. (in: a-proteobacteria)]
METSICGATLIRMTADHSGGNLPVSKPIPFGDVPIETSFKTIRIGQTLDAPQGIDFVDAVSKRKVFGTDLDKAVLPLEVKGILDLTQATLKLMKSPPTAPVAVPSSAKCC